MTIISNPYTFFRHAQEVDTKERESHFRNIG